MCFFYLYVVNLHKLHSHTTICYKVNFKLYHIPVYLYPDIRIYCEMI